jgi:hypothetical protein
MMPTAFGHPTTWIPMLLILVMGLSALVAYRRVADAVLAAVRANATGLDKTLEAAFQDATTPGGPLAEHLLQSITPIVEQVPSTAGKRWLVRGTLADLHETYLAACDEALRGRGRAEQFLVALGQSLTGIALFFTFGLIAWVLASEVPAAIQGVAQTTDAAAAQTGTNALQRAVGLMGAKFGISALGLLLSLVFRAVAASHRQEVANAVTASLNRNRAIFFPAADYRVGLLRSDVATMRKTLNDAIEGHSRAATERLDRLSSIEPSIRETANGFQSELRLLAETLRSDLTEARERLRDALIGQGQEVTRRLDELASIEVSVKDMGNEVKAHLGSLMKQHVADLICEAVAELRAFADQIAQRVEGTLTGAFTRLATEGIAQLNSALAGIRETIERQTKTDVEKLVAQMRDMLSGGFHTESEQMMQAMTSLREVLPALEVQLRKMTADVDRQARERAEENLRLQAEVLRQVETVVGANKRSQDALEDLLGRIGRIAEDTTHDLQARLSASGETALARLMEVSQGGLRNLSSQLAQMNEIANGNVTAFSKEVAAAAASLAGARTSLDESLSNLRGMANDLRIGLAGARDGLAAAARTGAIFSTAGDAIVDATRRTHDIVSTIGDRLTQEATLLESHKALAVQFENRLLPALERAFAGYTNAVEEQSRKLHDGWQQLAERVKHTVDACGAGLQDSVEQLADQVGVLKRQLDRAQPGKQGNR